MSTDAQTQTGQAPPAGDSDVPAAGSARQEPQSLIQESIKYRRRAQEAERRAEALETEVGNLRQAEQSRAAALETELHQARAEAETLRARVETLELDRRLERELARAGCADTETALALARERLFDGKPPEDPAAFAKALLEEKPHLCGPASGHPAGAPPALPPRTAGSKPAGENDSRRAAQRLAERARESGSLGDVMAYMRARRGVRAQAL